jgi:hypothetical protein
MSGGCTPKPFTRGPRVPTRPAAELGRGPPRWARAHDRLRRPCRAAPLRSPARARPIGRCSRALPPAPVSVRPARIESSASEPARVAGQASGAGELAGALATGGGAYYLAVLKGRRAQSTAGAALRRAWHTVQHMTCNLRHATCDVQHVTCNMRRTTCSMRRATCNVRRATYDVQHATWDTRHMAHAQAPFAAEDLAHYASAATDLQFNFAFGWHAPRTHPFGQTPPHAVISLRHACTRAHRFAGAARSDGLAGPTHAHARAQTHAGARARAHAHTGMSFGGSQTAATLTRAFTKRSLACGSPSAMGWRPMQRR